MGAEVLMRVLRNEAEGRLGSWRRDLERPWRRGQKGTAAETGRWLGFMLALGAFTAGLSTALYVEWRRER